MSGPFGTTYTATYKALTDALLDEHYLLDSTARQRITVKLLAAARPAIRREIAKELDSPGHGPVAGIARLRAAIPSGTRGRARVRHDD